MRFFINTSSKLFFYGYLLFAFFFHFVAIGCGKFYDAKNGIFLLLILRFYFILLFCSICSILSLLK